MIQAQIERVSQQATALLMEQTPQLEWFQDLDSGDRERIMTTIRRAKTPDAPETFNLEEHTILTLALQCTIYEILLGALLTGRTIPRAKESPSGLIIP